MVTISRLLIVTIIMLITIYCIVRVKVIMLVTLILVTILKMQEVGAQQTGMREYFEARGQPASEVRTRHLADIHLEVIKRLN